MELDAIRVAGLTRSFGATTAVDGLSLSVPEGELFGLVGPDGAGKSTTIRMLTGILDPSGGDAWVMGLHTVREAERLKDSIGYMSQRFGLYADLTVQENIDFYADIYGVPRRGRDAKVARLMEFSQLAPFRGRLAGRLSGGMKQKLGLACALIHTPRVLFLDEPTNGVDPVSRRDFWRILRELVDGGVTVFLSTSYLDEAERCTRLGLLHKGRLLAVGSPAEVRALSRDEVLVIRTPEPRRAAGVLRAAMPQYKVGVFGDRLHVAGPEAQDAASRACGALRDAGIEVTAASPAAPSLEDVFVSVLGGEGGGGVHG